MGGAIYISLAVMFNITHRLKKQRNLFILLRHSEKIEKIVSSFFVNIFSWIQYRASNWFPEHLFSIQYLAIFSLLNSFLKQKQVWQQLLHE